MAKKQDAKSAPSVQQALEDCRLITPGTEAGKQGKSTLVGHIVEWVRNYHPGIRMKLFDPDTIHYSLWRTFGPSPVEALRRRPDNSVEKIQLPRGASPFTPGEPHSIELLDLSGDEGYVRLDSSIETFADNYSLSIIDGVAQQFSSKFGAWARALDLDTLRKDYNFRVTYLLVVTEVSDTLTQAVDIMRTHEDRADYLIAKIQPRDGSKNDWDLDGAAPARALAEEVGARVIDIHTFRGEVRDVMNPTGSFAPTPTLWSIYNGSEHRALVRQRVRTDWVQIKAALDSVADVLIPPALLK
jgi:hypothetical protein